MNEFPSVLKELYRRRQSGVKYSLEGIRRILDALGSPQAEFKFIHIAGTNGKGSVAAMVASILQSSGKKTGLYTSPHLVHYQERFRFNGVEIPSDELEAVLSQVLPVAGDATFFEITTAVALVWFRSRQVEWVAWETGMGGRLDATNIVQPSVVVLTPVGMDHQAFLGSTLKEIAREKAGIMKPGVPVLTVPQNPVVEEVFRDQADQTGSTLEMISENDLDEFPSPLSGDFQRWNTALAVATVRKVLPTIPDEVIRKGLSRSIWPGRCQQLHLPDGQEILLDGAHNPLAASALKQVIAAKWSGRKVNLILGMLADKDVAGVYGELKSVVGRVWIVPVQSDRSSDPGELMKHIPGAKRSPSLESALSETRVTRKPVVICGSLFLVGEMLSRLSGVEAAIDPSESMTKAI